MNKATTAAVLLAAALATLSPGTGSAAERITMTSPAFTDGGDIPAAFTCRGKGASPPLAWSNVPDGVKSLALTVDDPDAPKPPFVHWVLYDMPPATAELALGVVANELPPGTLVGANGAKKPGYLAPCPPTGRHRYFFRIFALDTIVGPTKHPPTMDELERAMRGHVLARGTLMGTYEKAPE